MAVIRSFLMQLWTAALTGAAVLFCGHALAAGTRPAPEAERGELLFQQHCARCHGARGEGDGPDAARLSPRPANLTRGTFKLKSTAPGTPPSDEDLFRTISLGVRNTAMPAWEGILNVRKRRALVRYVQALAWGASPRAEPLALSAPPSPETLDDAARHRARELYTSLSCASCHGASGAGDGPAAATLIEPRGGGKVRMPDLSRPETFKGGGTAADIYLRLTAGMDGTAMPSYQDAAPAEDRLLLAAFIASGGFPQTAAPALARGRYLAEALACGYCHTAMTKDGTPRVDRALAGGTRIDLPPFARYEASNLTPDPTGIGDHSDEEVIAAIRRGRGLDGRRLQPLVMPWPYYAHLTDDDARALVLYLRTLPSVANRTAPPAPYGFFERTVGKARALLNGEPARVVLHREGDR